MLCPILNFIHIKQVLVKCLGQGILSPIAYAIEYAIHAID